MPNFDGTGPSGRGNMGGRRSGRCGGFNYPQERGQGRQGRLGQGNQGQGNFAGMGSVGASQDRGSLESWIGRLLSELQALQASLGRPKAKDGE